MLGCCLGFSRATFPGARPGACATPSRRQKVLQRKSSQVGNFSLSETCLIGSFQRQLPDASHILNFPESNHSA